MPERHGGPGAGINLREMPAGVNGRGLAAGHPDQHLSCQSAAAVISPRPGPARLGLPSPGSLYHTFVRSLLSKSHRQTSADSPSDVEGQESLDYVLARCLLRAPQLTLTLLTVLV